MRPGDLQAQVPWTNAFWFADREVRQRLTKESLGNKGRSPATPAHWLHTDCCGITKKRRFLTRRQSVELGIWLPANLARRRHTILESTHDFRIAVTRANRAANRDAHVDLPFRGVYAVIVERARLQVVRNV